MNIERQRGISVTVSVMTFEHEGITYNLLDTPGHEDFSEDTYRTLTAVDSAIMVLDAAKGIEPQTRKLFEVCRLRDVPIITFVNKMDREGREPFELLDEIASTLALDVSPASWPIGMGQAFQGCYDLRRDRVILMDRADRAVATEGLALSGLDDPALVQAIGDRAAARTREEVPMARELCPAFDLEAYRQGSMTPVFFGSALQSFGVKELLDGVAELAPSPRPQRTENAVVSPDDPTVSGFVFKIQANMDPRHRDRVAFVRLCSGHFQRGMRLTVTRSGKSLAVSNAVLFQARDRELAEEAYAGDIVGIPNHGVLHIGDTLSEAGGLRFPGVPRFAPELLQRVRPDDPMRAKHLGRALCQLAEEGAAQALKRRLGSEWVVGVVGRLQFDVLADRIRTEYGLPVHFESVPYVTARWAVCEDHRVLEKFCDAQEAHIADDHTGAPVFLAKNDWQLEHATDGFAGVKLLDVVQPHAAAVDTAAAAAD
jgi:peptide chain release factor 3